MLDKYYSNVRLAGETRIFGGLSLDFADFNPHSYYDEVNKVYHNYVLVPDGKHKGEMRPIKNACAYVFTPYNRDQPRILIFF